MQNYKDLKVWQKSHEFTLMIYQATGTFPKEELFGLVSQMRRSSVSVPANLAEGCGKNSSADIAKFFQIALGSLHETEYYILLAKDLKYIKMDIFSELENMAKEIKAMLVSLIKTVRNSSSKNS